MRRVSTCKICGMKFVGWIVGLKLAKHIMLWHVELQHERYKNLFESKIELRSKS